MIFLIVSLSLLFCILFVQSEEEANALFKKKYKVIRPVLGVNQTGSLAHDASSLANETALLASQTALLTNQSPPKSPTLKSIQQLSNNTSAETRLLAHDTSSLANEIALLADKLRKSQEDSPAIIGGFYAAAIAAGFAGGGLVFTGITFNRERNVQNFKISRELKDELDK